VFMSRLGHTTSTQEVRLGCVGASLRLGWARLDWVRLGLCLYNIWLGCILE
jgi:hypothetical protein